MKFDHLYHHVFLTEQDKPITAPEDVEPTSEVTPGEGGSPEPDNYNVEPAPTNMPSTDTSGIKNYKSQLIQFADAMQNTDGDCLQKLITDLDRPGSVFTGISRELSSRIIKIASEAKDIATILDGFVINSVKRLRDIAAGQQ